MYLSTVGQARGMTAGNLHRLVGTTTIKMQQRNLKTPPMASSTRITTGIKQDGGGGRKVWLYTSSVCLRITLLPRGLWTSW